MTVVADSSVLIALSSIGQLQILHQRFPGGILVPSAVWQEVVETGKGLPGAREVETASWIKVCKITNIRLFSLLSADLDHGEAEAIVLCLEQTADMILLDEKDARQVAQRLGLAVLGTIGLLIWAKRQRLIPSLQEQLDLLSTTRNFHISHILYEKALRSVGEPLP